MPLIDESKQHIVFEEFEEEVWRSMIAKKWYTSKTMIINIIAIVAMIANSIWGVKLDTELQAALVTVILAVINIIIRIQTTQPIEK